MTAPVEAKVQASSYAAAASGLALWALGTYVFKGAVPDVVVSWVYVAVPAALTFAAGWAARHTARPDEPAGPAGMPPRAEKTLHPPGTAPPPSVPDLLAPPPS